MARMSYCGPRGLPHSTFAGWSEDDQDLAIAWQQLQAVTCESCGTRADEFDPGAGGHPFAYIGDISRCPGCELLEQEQENIRDLAKTSDESATRGLQARLIRNPELVR